MSKELPEEVRAAYEMYKWLGSEIKGLEEQQKASRSVIEEYLGDDEELWVDDQKVMTWKWSDQRPFDQKLALQIYPDLEEKAKPKKRVRSLRVVGDE